MVLGDFEEDNGFEIIPNFKPKLMTSGTKINTNIESKQLSNTEYFGKPLYEKDFDEKSKIISEKLKISKEHADQYLQAANEFLHEDDAGIRNSGYKNLNNDKAIYSKNLDEFINISPKYDGQIYRGIKVDDNTLKEFDTKNIGTTIDMKGVSSWSSDMDVAKNYSKSATEHMTNRNGVVFITNGNNKTGASTYHLSGFENEKEVTVPSTTKYKIIHMEDKILTDENGSKRTVKYVYVDELD